MDLPARMTHFCRLHQLLPAGSAGVVCVSGGVDSVVLLAALRVSAPSLGVEVSAFHLHHGLRGEEADRDQAFVEAMCAAWDIPLVVQRLDQEDWGQPQWKGRSKQEAARVMRYERVLALAGERWVATAHNRSDQVETVVARIGRGTSVDGLAGIPVRRGQIVRPLLAESRAHIEAWAKQTGLAWVEDSSNQRQVYERVRIRTQVLPLLREVLNPRVDDAVVELAERARQDSQFIEGVLEEGWRVHTTVQGRLLLVELAWLKELPPALLNRALRRILLAGGVTRLEGEWLKSLHQWVMSAGPRWPLPRGGVVWRERPYLCVDPQPPVGISPRPLELGQTLELPAGKLSLRGGHREVGGGDPGRGSPLIVRSWQPGDLLHHHPGQPPRKVADWFIDASIPLRLRLQLPVVVRGEKILWVGGLDEAEVALTPEIGTPDLVLVWSPRWSGDAAP